MKTIKRKGITFQIDKEDEDDFIFYITKVKEVTRFMLVEAEMNTELKV